MLLVTTPPSSRSPAKCDLRHTTLRARRYLADPLLDGNAESPF
jgi:hypothetical protein